MFQMGQNLYICVNNSKQICISISNSILNYSTQAAIERDTLCVFCDIASSPHNQTLEGTKEWQTAPLILYLHLYLRNIYIYKRNK